MRITRKIAAAGVAGVLTVAGVGVLAPAAFASTVAATDDSTAGTTGDAAAEPTVGDRLQAIKDALAGLVSDGTLTQAQADTVATTLDESDALRGHGPGPGHGHGGRGPGPALDAAADALGMTDDELRTALAVDGTTLTDVASAQGVDVAVLTDALVAAGTERITQEATDGRLTQAEADERIAALPDRVASLLDDELGAGRGHGAGHHTT